MDHIIPRYLFEFKTINDVDFKLYWNINNLQPLINVDNVSKHDKVLFQFINNLNKDYLKDIINNTKTKRLSIFAKHYLTNEKEQLHDICDDGLAALTSVRFDIDDDKKIDIMLKSEQKKN